MNIMIAVTNMTAANGGVTTHIIDLCRELSNRGIKVILLSDEKDCDYKNKIGELLQIPNFKFETVDLSGVQTNLNKIIKSTKRIMQIVKKEQVDLIHTHSQSLCVIGSIIKFFTGTPYIWTNHIDEMANPELFKIVLKVLHFPIISVSTDLKNMLINDFGLKGSRIRVINNGIYAKDFYPLEENEKNELKQKFNCKGKYVISLLARMSYGKGHMYLLEAINKMQTEREISNVKLLIAGKCHKDEEKYLKRLQEYSNNHDIDMEFLGFQKPRDVFGISNISVLPSIYEGFGLTVIESCAMECPVIRSRTPGWIDTDEIALSFEKEDVDGLYEKLVYAYYNNDDMINLAKKGKQVVMDKFTIEHQVNETVDFYNNILSHN